MSTEELVDGLAIEFWNKSTRDSFVDAANTLKKYSVPEREIINVLESLFSAVSSEFGE